MFVGIDVGTSAVKIVVVDQDQRIVAASEQPLHPTQPRPLWSEDDPDAWWAAVLAGMDRIGAEHATVFGRVRAIGLSGQMHAAVLLDEADRPIRSAILWNDGRAFAEAAALAELGTGLQRELGVLPMPGFTGPKIAWLARHEPEALARTRRLVLAKDYIRLRLTGDHATDVSDAAGTWLFDEAARRWSTEAVQACAVDPAWLPDAVESATPTGELRPEWARRWGMTVGVIVVAGAGDAAAGAIGVGAVNAGQAYISLGTSAQVFVVAESHQPDPARMVHAFCHAVPQRWFRMAALLNGASPLAAVARWTGQSRIDTLLADIEARYRGPSNLLALPYLFGERTPHNDPHARGAIIGLTGSTQTTDIAQAMIEAVAFSLADGLAVIDLAVSAETELGFIGGGARSAFWGRIIASVLGVTLVQYDDAGRGPAFGAARLARVGYAGELVAEVAVPPPVRKRISPDQELHRLYQPRVEAFRSLYRALRPLSGLTL